MEVGSLSEEPGNALGLCADMKPDMVADTKLVVVAHT
jgi:hypothetical protein